MVQRISSIDSDVLPEATRVFYRGALKFQEFSDGTIVPVVRGGAVDDGFDDADANTDDDTDDTDEESDDDADESDDDGDESEGTKSKGDPKLQRLSREAARHRMRAKKLRTENESLKADLKKIREEGVTDEEGKKLKADGAKLQQDNEALQLEVKTLKVGQSIRDEMQNLNLNPKKAKAIVKLIELDDIDVDEDGEVSGVVEALEAVAQDYPEWVMSQGDDDDDKGNGNGRSSGQSSRKPTRKKASGVDKAKLMQQFPALGRGYLG